MQKGTKIILVLVVFLAIMIPILIIGYRLYSEQAADPADPEPEPTKEVEEEVEVPKKVIYISSWGSSYKKTKPTTETYVPIQALCLELDSNTTAPSWCTSVLSNTSSNTAVYALKFDEQKGECMDGTEDCKYNEVQMEGKVVGYFNSNGRDMLDTIVKEVYSMKDADFTSSKNLTELLYTFDMDTGLVRKKSDNTPVIPVDDLLIPQYAGVIATFYRAAGKPAPMIRVNIDNVSLPTISQSITSFKKFKAMLIANNSRPAVTAPSVSSNAALVTTSTETPPPNAQPMTNVVPGTSNATPTSTGPVLANPSTVDNVEGASIE